MPTSQQNPLIPQILHHLQQHMQSPTANRLGIHHLLTQLADHPAFHGLPGSDELTLFKKNFLMMNALYQLQAALWEDERLQLVVDPLDLRLLSAQSMPSTETEQAGLIESDPMRAYYLDWRHYEDTTHEQVVALLAHFWQRVQGEEPKAEALAVLGLAPEADAAAVRRRYRQLAKQHHPDTGGDAAAFIAVRQAYETLRNGV